MRNRAVYEGLTADPMPEVVACMHHTAYRALQLDYCITRLKYPPLQMKSTAKCISESFDCYYVLSCMPRHPNLQGADNNEKTTHPHILLGETRMGDCHL